MSLSPPHVNNEASASTSNPSTSLGNPPSYDEIRQQAGPLPSKRGELGFIEGVHVQQERQQEDNAVTLPARHPADRERDDPPTTAVPLTPAPNSSAPNNSSRATTSTEETPATSTDSAAKPNGIFKFLKPKSNPTFHGLRLTTLLAFGAQFLVFTGCAIAWGFAAKRISSMQRQGVRLPGGITSTIFVHVVFTFAIIGQLIFLERRIYRLRAERYAYLHPGEMLPRYQDRLEQGGDLSFAYAPWNRPPLPTYAAALAQSGHGTGDVDDHLIAVPPPPAYGNTRGSTLLLSGYLRDSLRAQRPPSIHSERDLERGPDLTDAGANQTSRDSHLQQTLAQLERTSTRAA